MTKVAPDSREARVAALRKRAMGSVEDWIKTNKPPEDVRPPLRFGEDIPPMDLVSTGNFALDSKLGGGIPTAQMVELSGGAGAGKTSTAAFIARQVQDRGQFVVWYLAEGDEPREAFALAGIDQSMVIKVYPSKSGEDCMDLVFGVVMRDGKWPDPLIGLIVIDSVAAMIPAAEVNQTEDKGLEGNTIGAHARMISKMFRFAQGKGVCNAGAIFLLINQERTQFNNNYTVMKTTGGQATEYDPKIRIRLAKSNSKDDKVTLDGKKTSPVVGHLVNFSVFKNSTGSAQPMTEGSYRVYYKRGIDEFYSLVEEAIACDVIHKPSSAYFQVRRADGTISEKVNGRENFEEHLKNHPEVQDEIKEQVRLCWKFLRATGTKYLPVNGTYQDQATNQPVSLIELARLAEGITVTSVTPEVLPQDSEPGSREKLAELTAQASEESLGHIWNTPEEEAAWKSLTEDDEGELTL